MEEQTEEIKVGKKVYLCTKVDFSRLEQNMGYKDTAFPKVENIASQLESAACARTSAVAVAEYTHFVSIPLAIYPEVRNAFVELKKAILSDEDFPIDRDLFISKKKLHLTITMLRLETKDKVTVASEALTQALDEVVHKLKLCPLKLTLKGLGTFGGKRVDKTNIVYGTVQSDAEYKKLMQIADVIIKRLIAAKVLTKDQLSHISHDPAHDVYIIDQMHMTLLNTKYKAKEAGGKEREYLFNSAGIMRAYSTYLFGVCFSVSGVGFSL